MRILISVLFLDFFPLSFSSWPTGGRSLCLYIGVHRCFLLIRHFLCPDKGLNRLERVSTFLCILPCVNKDFYIFLKTVCPGIPLVWDLFCTCLVDTDGLPCFYHSQHGNVTVSLPYLHECSMFFWEVCRGVGVACWPVLTIVRVVRGTFL